MSNTSKTDRMHKYMPTGSAWLCFAKSLEEDKRLAVETLRDLVERHRIGNRCFLSAVRAFTPEDDGRALLRAEEVIARLNRCDEAA